MTAAALWWSSWLTSFAAMAALCAQAPTMRSRMAWPKHSDSQRAAIATSAVALLALSFAAAWRADSAAFASVLWLCELGAAGLLLIIALPYKPTWVMNAAFISAASGIVLFAIGMEGQ